MIKRFGDYDKVQGYGNSAQLPKGGYIMEILGVSQEMNSNGTYYKISADVKEGEHAGFFTRDYRSQTSEDKKWRCNFLLNEPKDDGTEQDAWTKRKFKTFTEALEDSNPGYHFDWDEQKFKHKLIGGLFNEREYRANDGSIRRATNWGGVCTVDRIRSGDYQLPKDKTLDGNRYVPVPDTSGFVNVPDGTQEELPFA